MSAEAGPPKARIAHSPNFHRGVHTGSETSVYNADLSRRPALRRTPYLVIPNLACGMLGRTLLNFQTWLVVRIHSFENERSGGSDMYHYDALNDERFQELCQALIVTHSPNAQCLPVGQPDGGRDAFLQLHVPAQRSDLVVYQVKYVKNPQDSRSERDFLEQIIKTESPRISKLRGLKKYYLITNLKGTAHPEKGSIDRVNEQLPKALGVESFCWWRDDIDRRLDGQPSIKWSYPEILKATDLLHSLVAGSLGEHEERRRTAIRAYLTAQYDDDKDLKFKQADLRGTITDLFVDLPLRPSSEPSESGALRKKRHFYIRPNYIRSYAEHGQFDYAANFFSHCATFPGLDRVILEGAPGQGKSTVTQFICQVMRMRLLNKKSELRNVAAHFRSCTVRLPFRIDLRDLAKWIAGVDPFQPKPTELSETDPKSLEGFLSAHVRHNSGGHAFSVTDLFAVAKASHVFVALDGFDEVANVEMRQKLVAEITRGCARLMSAGGFSVQTLVTSRPAAFSKAVRFPKEQWQYFELMPLDKRDVESYSKRWMKAKRLKDAEQVEMSRVLEAKLREPHTQFLSKNPMQLTILLYLIHNRGASLPEKRTAMYDQYMDMFFSRESEKSAIVRDHRELLIDMHRYLAWKLQTAAEEGENGSIEHNALRQTLLLYLDSQGECTSIVDALFDGVIQRVGALVSRVQDTYEFEVQPLREYFAAKHLYETAPYSPAGDERAGNKLDRFNALVKNPYWLNVARFYGGCFSKGEISALVDELQELADLVPYKDTSHAQSIALMLLGDWVFTQYQPAVRRVVTLIGEQRSLRRLLGTANHPTSSSWLALPDRSGRSDLLDVLWARLERSVHLDERNAIASAINLNSGLPERRSRWINLRGKLALPTWLKLGGALDILKRSDARELTDLDLGGSKEFAVSLVEAGQFAYLEDSELKTDAERAILSEVQLFRVPTRKMDAHCGPLESLAMIVSYFQYGVALDNDGMNLRETMELRYRYHRSVDGASRGRKYQIDEAKASVIAAYNDFMDAPSSLVSTALEPWVNLVEALRRAWGDCPAVDRIAFTAVGIRSREQSGLDVRLSDADNLVAAARFVRLKSGAPRWWAAKLESEQFGERNRLLLLLWTWGTTKTIMKLASVLSEILDGMSEAEWSSLCREISALPWTVRNRDDFEGEVSRDELNLVRKFGSRYSMFLGVRLNIMQRQVIARDLPTRERCGSPEIQFAMDTVVFSMERSGDWSECLPTIKALYARGGVSRSRFDSEICKPGEIYARQVAESPDDYPLSLVTYADSQLRTAIGEAAPKLISTANANNWF